MEQISPDDSFKEKISREADKHSETGSVITDRGLNDYCREFNLSPCDFKNKKILDIGSGKRESFSKEASKVGAEVFSLNPALWIKDFRDLARKNISEWQKRSVGGRAQELPFANETFDMITSLYAVPYYIDTKGWKFNAVKEMVRVLKPGGTIRIGPGVGKGKPHENLEELFGQDTLLWLKENNCDLSEDPKSGSIIIKKTFKQ